MCTFKLRDAKMQGEGVKGVSGAMIDEREDWRGIGMSSISEGW